MSRKQYIRHVLEKPLDSEPGTKFAYNNATYALLAAVVEEVAKAKGYDLVLDSQVAYTISRDFDITREVISQADEKLPGTEGGDDAAAPSETPQ